jgi:hypothetical protein
MPDAFFAETSFLQNRPQTGKGEKAFLLVDIEHAKAEWFKSWPPPGKIPAGCSTAGAGA